MGRLGVGFLHLSAVPTEGRGGCWIPQNWSYGGVCLLIWELSTESQSSPPAVEAFSWWASIPLFVHAFELGLCLCKSHYSLVSMAIIFFSWCNIPIFALTFLVCCLFLYFLPDTQLLLCFLFLPSSSPSLPPPYLPPALLFLSFSPPSPPPVLILSPCVCRHPTAKVCLCLTPFLCFLCWDRGS